MFSLAATARLSSPPGTGAGVEARDDPAARALLQRAQGLIQKWPEGFGGFRAGVRCRQGDRQDRGRVTLTAGRGGHVELDAADLRAGVEAMLADLAARHTPRFFKDGDGRHAVSFEDVPGAAAGWRVRVHGGPAEWRVYGIDPRVRLREIEWLTPERRAVITIEEYLRATPGRLLPARSTVTVWQGGAGPALPDRIEDRYRRVGDVWLAVERRIEPAGGAAAVEIELLDPAPV